MTTEVMRLLPIEWAEYFDGDCDEDSVSYAPEALRSWLYNNPTFSFIHTPQSPIRTELHHVPEFAGGSLSCYRFYFYDTSKKRHPLAAKTRVVVGNRAKLPLPKVPA